MLSTHKKSWSSESWTAKHVHEQPITYENEAQLDDVLSKISQLPPLVTPDSIEQARRLHASAARGDAFILLGGDCAESFDDVKDDIINQKATLLIDQASHIEAVTGRPVHITARIAGQYAKPRSSLTETLPDGREVNAFRGHNINGAGLSERAPDPLRLLLGYWHSVATLHGLSSSREEIFTAHEALHLPLESAMTRGVYNTSAAFLWLGERTRQLDGAHLEYLRGLKNPIGIKLGPKTKPSDTIALLEALCGNNPSEAGRVTLITRIGADGVTSVLPPIIEAIQNSDFDPVWMCDPCHGNTFSRNGAKSRSLSTMLWEVEQTITVLSRYGLALGGLHLEQTGEDVSECVDSDGGHISLGDDYKTLCDPRLSGRQAMFFIERVAEMLSAADLPATPKWRSSEGQPILSASLEHVSKTLKAWLPVTFGFKSHSIGDA